MPASSEIDLRKRDTPVIVLMAYSGAERKCWDCGDDRLIMLRFDIDGTLDNFEECCASDGWDMATLNDPEANPAAMLVYR